MKQCNIDVDRAVVEEVASRKQHGGNDAWVLAHFVDQLHACRQRAKKAKTLLVVFIDADRWTVDERRREFNLRLEQVGREPLHDKDPFVLLIPRRHIETWISSLLGQTVNETDSYKTGKAPSKPQIREAAQTLFEWARENARPGPTCVPSLATALPQWRKIG
jgi:hypothetical protein